MTSRKIPHMGQDPVGNNNLPAYLSLQENHDSLLTLSLPQLQQTPADDDLPTLKPLSGMLRVNFIIALDFLSHGTNLAKKVI